MVADEATSKEAYRALDDALQRVIELTNGPDGILVEWMITYAIQTIDKTGDSLTATGYIVDPDNNTPHYRLMGLLDYVQTILKNQILENDG